MSLSQANITLQRFFSGISEHVFEAELGVADPPLIDYISGLLLRFLRMDGVQRMRALNGRPLAEVTEMVAEAEARIGDARREAHRHIGDVALFWTGLYPESLRERQSPDKKDHFIDYCEQGKRAYYVASRISSEREETSAELLERLSRNFDLCAYGLREIRREWERRDDDDDEPPRPLL